jgi:hypothetical protein
MKPPPMLVLLLRINDWRDKSFPCHDLIWVLKVICLCEFVDTVLSIAEFTILLDESIVLADRGKRLIWHSYHKIVVILEISAG